MKKGIIWTTFIVMFALVITMSTNLISGSYWQCATECPNSCEPRCEGHKCYTYEGDECCGRCEDDEGTVICVCCFRCGGVPI